MAKIYFTVDTRTAGFPIHYLSERGEKQIANEIKASDPGQARQEFTAAHPGAQYLTWLAFDSRARQAAADRMKLLAWKEWAV